MKGHLYFVGIAGHAMRGLALAARDAGYEVSGLDETAVPPGSTWLDEQKFSWSRKFELSQLDRVTDIIITGAHVSDEYPVIVEARKRDIPIKSYAEFFGSYTQGKHVIDVAGTHGKTTTTSLIAWLMEHAGRNPSFLIGIRPFNFESSVRFTNSGLVVAEGDEYKASMLDPTSKVQYYHPDTLILTSVEHDHPDLFPDLASVIRRFKDIVGGLPASGRLIAWAESPAVTEVALAAPCPVITYGLGHGEYIARNIAYIAEGIEFDIEHGDVLGHIAVQLYGRHNVLNTLAAVAASLSEGLNIEEVIAGSAKFRGAYRRFNLISKPEAAVTIVDDYAHHPSEVATNIEAAKLHFQGRRVIVIFRPHTYSRTAALLTEYQQAFEQADVVYITDIEGAREADKAHEVSGADITRVLKMPARYTPDRADLVDQVVAEAKPGDVVLCFTVSGYDNLAEELAVRTESIS